MRVLGGIISLIGILIPVVPLTAQQLLNWAKDDGERVATLQRDGAKLESEHVIIWYPKSLSEPDAQALITRLDPGVAGLWQRVGTHPWQAVRKGKITYYLSDDMFVSHASGRAAVFVPMARVRDGHAPFLHEATHELLASTRRDRGPDVVRRPLWLTEGLPDYIARLVAADLGTTESGPFETPMISSADGICAERARTANGATMMPFIGSTAWPDVLYTTDRGRFAPTFYTCSLSFVSYLVDHVALSTLIDLFDMGPAEMIARLNKMRGKTIAGWRSEWLQKITLN